MSRKETVFAILGAFFLTNALLAEVIGSKLIYVAPEDLKFDILGFTLGPFGMSVGIIPWPVVFVTTDIINEYFGKRGVRRLTFLAVAMIIYAFVILWLTMQIPAAGFSKVKDPEYNSVFGSGLDIIVGSITAFLLAQLLDVFIFQVLRRRTGKALIWLRATGSTVISQLIDTMVVLWIGIAIPQGWTLEQFINVAAPNYTVKLIIAVLMTPVIYLAHWGVERYLGKPLAEELSEQAARESQGAA